jgi:hypothetical protein
LRRNSHLLQVEEWTKLEEKWNKICAYMRDWNALFDKELPEPLASIAEWLATGEKLVHSGNFFGLNFDFLNQNFFVFFGLNFDFLNQNFLVFFGLNFDFLGLELDGKSDLEAMKYMERTVSFHHVSLVDLLSFKFPLF